jgi:hypothetical protein
VRCEIQTWHPRSAAVFLLTSSVADRCRVNSCVRMFGNLVHRLQSLSPLGSPLTSPVSSPKASRRGFKSPRRPPAVRRKEECREVQSDPELDEADAGKKFRRTSRHLLDKRKNKLRGAEPKTNSNTCSPLQGSKSLGRLDGLKEVGTLTVATRTNPPPRRHMLTQVMKSLSYRICIHSRCAPY